jgi:hypothetical protein
MKRRARASTKGEAMSATPEVSADIARLCAKLRAIEGATPDFIGVNDGGCHTRYHRNPDGPQAADLIERLVLRIATIEGALEEARERLVRLGDDGNVCVAALKSDRMDGEGK